MSQKVTITKQIVKKKKKKGKPNLIYKYKYVFMFKEVYVCSKKLWYIFDTFSFNVMFVYSQFIKKCT